MNEIRTYYRRHLPHYQPPEGTFHVVFRLAGSLPASVIEELRNEREQAKREIEKANGDEQRKRMMRKYHWSYFERFDALLDGNSTGPLWLREPAVASIVKEALHYRDGKEYDLLAYCIMPNHVHLVVGRTSVRPDADDNDSLTGRAKARPTGLTETLRLIKGSTALACNRVLGRTGASWQHESFDHVIRNTEELERTIWYVLNNPVKAELVNDWKDWPWTYIKPELV